MKPRYPTRREMLLAGIAGIGVVSLAPLLRRGGDAAHAEEETFEIMLSEAEWRSRLTPDQFAVLREEATERAFSSPLDDEYRKGLFHCAGCDLPVYSSEAKFDSGTGWPSFWQALPDAIGTKPDRTLFSVRTEVHCRRCGGHFGHIFDDGPPPTGKRHCLNGDALKFVLA